jgi:hypothetical protein
LRRNSVLRVCGAFLQGLKLRTELALADRESTTLSTELVASLYRTSTVADNSTARNLLGQAIALLAVLEREQRSCPNTPPGRRRSRPSSPS